MKEKSCLIAPRLRSKHSRAVIKCTYLRLDRSNPLGEATTSTRGGGPGGGEAATSASVAVHGAPPRLGLNSEHLSSIPE